MNDFDTVDAAREYLVARIMEEASREGVVISGEEHRMLFYSDSNLAVPETAKEFENKIALLIAHAGQYASEQGTLKPWNEAIAMLRREDYYLSVIIDLAHKIPRPQGHWPHL
jgi:hypothetical protein